MKKLILILFLGIGLCANSQSTLNSGITVTAQQSVDAKQYKLSAGKHTPWLTPTEFLTTIPSTRRHVGQVAYVANGPVIETWQFVGGITDISFKKVSNGVLFDSTSLSARIDQKVDSSTLSNDSLYNWVNGISKFVGLFATSGSSSDGRGVAYFTKIGDSAKLVLNDSSTYSVFSGGSDDLNDVAGRDSVTSHSIGVVSNNYNYLGLSSLGHFGSASLTNNPFTGGTLEINRQNGAGFVLDPSFIPSGTRTLYPFNSGTIATVATDSLNTPMNMIWQGPDFKFYKAAVPVSGESSGMADSLVITPNMFAGLGLNDVEKIQRALDTSVSQHKKLVIPYNQERASKYWMIDSAILLRSNSYIVIENAVLKLTDSSRDNILRTENVGIGKTTPYLNPMQNITIIGRGEASFEGANNPRSTGDAGKSLSLSPSLGMSNSYGTDAGISGRSQFGDWRNYGVIIAYSTNVKVSGIKLSYMHAYGISFERCRFVDLTDVNIDMPGYAAGGVSRLIKNNGAIDFNQSINDVNVNNVFGRSADDNIALNIINMTPGINGAGGAGATRAYHATGDTSNSVIDSISNVNISNVNSKVFDNSIRLLVPPNGCKASNINISNITNTASPSDSLYTDYGSGSNTAVVIIGSTNPVYGGNNPLGQISNMTIDNIKSNHTKYGVWVQTSITESTISNVYKGSTVYESTLPVFADTPAIRFRNTKIINSGNRFVDFTSSTASTSSDTLYKFSASDIVSSSLTNNGNQQWTLSNSGSNLGKIVLAAQNNNPGFAFFRGSGLTQRFDIVDSTTAFTLKPNPNNSNGGISVLHSDGSVGIGVSAPTSLLHVKKTLPTTYASTVQGVFHDITSAGSQSTSDVEQWASYTLLNAGYTGNQGTVALRCSNLAAGTGGQMIRGGTPLGNSGVSFFSGATTTGYNYGAAGFSRLGNISIGGLFRAGFSAASSNKANATYIGTMGVARNETTGTSKHIGGYFGLNDSDPTFESAALIADNANTTAPILLLRDNGTTTFTVADGGAVTSTSTITSTQFRLSALNTAPANATDTGTTGEIRIVNGFIYICVATNTWQRTALATW